MEDILKDSRGHAAEHGWLKRVGHAWVEMCRESDMLSRSDYIFGQSEQLRTVPYTRMMDKCSGYCTRVFRTQLPLWREHRCANIRQDLQPFC